MSNQIFKKFVSKEKLFEFLDKTATKKNNSYVFSKVNFKTAQFNNLITPFCDTLKENYHKSKLKYTNIRVSINLIVAVILLLI